MKVGYDIAKASRYLPPATSQEDDFASKLVNRWGTKHINFIFAARVTDALGMYKAFKKEHLYKLEINQHKNEHSEHLLIARGARYGLKKIEISSRDSRRMGRPGSRAHLGILGIYKTCAVM